MTLVDYLNQIIGINYADSPMVWTIACMILVWLIYQLFTLLYAVTGIHK